MSNLVNQKNEKIQKSEQKFSSHVPGDYPVGKVNNYFILGKGLTFYGTK